MKCKCGCDRFFANQLLRVEVIVDQYGVFDNNAGDTLESSIYDSETYGPYTCVKCGAEYEHLD